MSHKDVVKRREYNKLYNDGTSMPIDDNSRRTKRKSEKEIVKITERIEKTRSKNCRKYYKEMKTKSNVMKHRKEVQRKRREKEAAKLKLLRLKYLGDSCVICKTKRGKLFAHRKDGESHKELSNINLKEIQEELETDEYILLCYRCHKSVHWCMEKLGVKWKEIKDRTDMEVDVNA